MGDSSIYILIAFIALGLVAWILIKKKKRHRSLSSLATTAILLNILGIIIGETKIFTYTFGYGLISVGLVLSIIGIVVKTK
ncbi:MAG: LPXTG cell wall anchor domain-containing protein [Candidatus Staskawiczbacteria bacterium]|nr:LPXTG cell wall anchor domain-containing protein [Candidatus Staskawiczbacteria bacterium]